MQLLLTVLFIYIAPLVSASDHNSPFSGEHYASYPTVKSSPLVDKGEYLVIAGDCIACHSKPDGKAFAGGLPINSPFGIFYAPNITPDKQYGIGDWTDEDLIRALKHGMSPEGYPYYPALPYPYYSKYSDEDVQAIRAYLMSIPAVSQPSQAHEVSFPFNIRWLVTFWNMLYFYPFQGEYVADPKLSSKINRGAFLVEGPAHCGMCHTPRDPLGGPIRSRAYTGAVVDGWYAPNITGSNLKKVSEGELYRLFVYDEKPGGRGKIQGPMREVNHDSLERMKESDLFAIAAYIKSTVDKTPVDTVPTKADHGKVVYDQKCAACHNVGAAGAPKITDKTAWQIRFKKPIDELYHNVINGYNAMSARGLCSSADDENCSDQDMEDAVNYIRKKAIGDTVVMTTAEPITDRKVAKVDAARLFQQSCQRCHDHDGSQAPQLGAAIDWQGRGGFDKMLRGVILGPKSGQSGHSVLANGGCSDCNTKDMIAILKYILSQSIKGKNYELW